MSSEKLSRRLLVAYSVLMTGISFCLAACYFLLVFDVMNAHQQTADFEYLCAVARDGSAFDGELALQEVVQFYPSGTKLRAGSQLDRIVQRSRRWATLEIVSQLRQK